MVRISFTSQGITESRKHVFDVVDQDKIALKVVTNPKTGYSRLEFIIPKEAEKFMLLESTHYQTIYMALSIDMINEFFNAVASRILSALRSRVDEIDIDKLLEETFESDFKTVFDREAHPLRIDLTHNKAFSEECFDFIKHTLLIEDQLLSQNRQEKKRLKLLVAQIHTAKPNAPADAVISRAVLGVSLSRTGAISSLASLSLEAYRNWLNTTFSKTELETYVEYCALTEAVEMCPPLSNMGYILLRRAPEYFPIYSSVNTTDISSS